MPAESIEAARRALARMKQSAGGSRTAEEWCYIQRKDLDLFAALIGECESQTTRIREEAAQEFIVWLVETVRYPFDVTYDVPPPVDHDRLADYWNEHDGWDIPAEDARACVREEAGIKNGGE